MISEHVRSLRRHQLARHRGVARTVGILFALQLLAACDAQRTITSEAAQYTLEVRVQLPASLSTVGQSLGWPTGRIPGARVIAIRQSTGRSEPGLGDTVLSDVQGVARFLTLSRGSYAFRIDRTFTTDERSRVSEALSDVEALVNTAAVRLADSTSTTLDVALNPTAGSSLIFTEIAPSWPQGKNGDQYCYGGYFRITNNSDTAVALPKRVWFDAYGGFVRSSTIPNGCSFFLPLERDPAGVWTRWVHRFPADAKPLAPGASVLLATDAIDHRKFGGAGFHDLSQAEFEFVFGSDVDNPLSQNMISIAPREYDFNHGWRFRGGRQVWGLASPLNLDTLPRISRLPEDASQST